MKKGAKRISIELKDVGVDITSLCDYCFYDEGCSEDNRLCGFTDKEAQDGFHPLYVEAKR